MAGDRGVRRLTDLAPWLAGGGLARWGLEPDGAPLETHSSRLLPVRQGGVPAMLKWPRQPEERAGSRLMPWWEGDGAARVLAWDGDALLLERATGPLSLSVLARGGGDEAATRILCATAARLHAPRDRPPPELVPPERWFADLWPAAERQGGWLAEAAATARDLLGAPRDPGVLHGDLHHDNVLDFGPGGWKAIDPKGLWGERGYDFANLLRNPDEATATAPGRLARQAALVAEAAGLEPRRLLRWGLAHAGLSTAWRLEEGGEPPALNRRVAEIILAELARG